jgi:hypothetical protein
LFWPARDDDDFDIADSFLVLHGSRNQRRQCSRGQQATSALLSYSVMLVITADHIETMLIG